MNSDTILPRIRALGAEAGVPLSDVTIATNGLVTLTPHTVPTDPGKLAELARRVKALDPEIRWVTMVIETDDD